jgi:pyruvate-formate lyase-activating enzyme
VRLFEKPYRKWRDENGKQLRDMIKYHKKKNRNFWISNLIRECSNAEQIDQIPLLSDVMDLLVQVKALDKHGHYKRVEQAILDQCSYNNVYLQGDADKAEEIISKVHEAYANYSDKMRQA